ncbi:ABC transporter [Candidatus Roizmanbacteria bacterium RIFCSPHIGHO2_12_FULL_37_9b]|uniref:ABC transporter n=1 Tax=Candidatus Roizmanbacteria bacterium RIFCSPHIGHO2_02_FULL_38_11 TaxID=1802039 RepID=A0A1F7GZ49_9BACT|nr:MAG: ABC transporter [Candidatus Roizmanbacteria bacterium RIFCSPHIGHO2_02_FULL_38_11]OGK32932.1 MAG: ABC transporter [Candidatus Roizmanbacteria bacterium RIFCSPHIGHO2_12_FULL_37_9b]
MKSVSVKNLTKYFRVHQKEAGVAGSLKSLFHRKYYDSKAVDNISFEIDEGELIGFIGPNGAGKTTTLKCLSGLLHPTSGEVSVLGFKPFDRKNEFLRKISLVMGQKNQLWWDLPPMESFLLNKEIYQVSDRNFKKNIEELVTLLDVKDVLNIQVRRLSLGQRMKCELIAALIHSPHVLFLDEPTIGLDVVMQKNLRSFIKEYNKRFNATIILTSHYMGDVEELCSRVMIIDHGKIIYDGSLEQIIKKYAKNKLLTVIFSKAVEKEKLQQFGQIKEYDNLKVRIAVAKESSNKVASKILNDFPVEDINIEDPEIETIVRFIFKSKKV